MIEPDDREQIYIDVMYLLEQDSDNYLHYWTTLINRFKILDNEEVLPICRECESLDIIRLENKHYCKNDVDIVYDADETGRIVVRDHKIIGVPSPIYYETQNQSIERMLKKILLSLMESGGYMMSLYELEEYLFNRPLHAYFETKWGIVTKSDILQKLNTINDYITQRMIQLRKDVRFTMPTIKKR